MKDFKVRLGIVLVSFWFHLGFGSIAFLLGFGSIETLLGLESFSHEAQGRKISDWLERSAGVSAR